MALITESQLSARLAHCGPFRRWSPFSAESRHSASTAGTALRAPQQSSLLHWRLVPYQVYSGHSFSATNWSRWERPAGHKAGETDADNEHYPYGEKYRAQLVPGDILSRHSDQEPIWRHWLSRRHPLKRTRPCVLDVLEFGGNDDAFLMASVCMASVARLEFVSPRIGQRRHSIPTAGSGS